MKNIALESSKLFSVEHSGMGDKRDMTGGEVGGVYNNAWTESKCHIVCHISIFYNCTVASHHDGT